MAIRKEDSNLKFLYKYRPLQGDSPTELNRNTQKLLENGEIFFSKPSTFNDPFDSKVEYSTNVTEKELTSYFSSRGLAQNVIDDLVSQLRAGTLDVKLFAPGVGGGYTEPLNVFCLARNETNILMWSHYAKDHTGICVGVRTHIASNSLNIRVKTGYTKGVLAGHPPELLPGVYVDYTDTKPKAYNIFTGSDKDIVPFILKKSKLWEYEKEVRLILPDSILLKNPVVVEKEEIGEIIFGLKTSTVLEQRVRDIVSSYPNNGAGVSFFRCIEKKGAYAIEKVGA